MEGQMVIKIRNFRDPEYSVNGYPVHYSFEEHAAALYWLEIKIFLNGHTPDNEGRVSVELCAKEEIDITYLNCTVSIVDANGKSRYPQSFGVQGVVLDAYLSLEVSFVKRCDVLDPDKELLREDALTLQFDISYDVKTKHNRLLYSHLRNDKCACDKLGDRAKHHEMLLRTLAFKSVLTCIKIQLTPIGLRCISTELITFLQQENIEHIDSVDKCIVLYCLSLKYGMLDLKEICSEHLKRLFTSEKAVEILYVAELYQDEELRDYATVYFLLNWNDVKNSADWAVLCENYPVFSNGVSRLVNDMEVQNFGIEAGMRKLVLRYVLRNWNEVQKYRRLTTTVQKLIASCLRKEFDLLFLNSNEFDAIEEYKQHAKDYDFYR